VTRCAGIHFVADKFSEELHECSTCPALSVANTAELNCSAQCCSHRFLL